MLHWLRFASVWPSVVHVVSELIAVSKRLIVVSNLPLHWVVDICVYKSHGFSCASHNLHFWNRPSMHLYLLTYLWCLLPLTVWKNIFRHTKARIFIFACKILKMQKTKKKKKKKKRGGGCYCVRNVGSEGRQGRIFHVTCYY